MTQRDGGEESLRSFSAREAGDQSLELGAVVDMDEVSELVDDHVVEDPRR